jgi:opacity protein-like surface antigen
LAFLAYAGPKAKKENAQIETGEGKSGGNKARKGKVELSTAASLYIDRVKTKLEFPSNESEYAVTITTLSIPVRVGYFLTDNIEIEPEITHTYMKYSQQDYSSSTTTSLLLANVVFNFNTPSQVMPFVLGGVGLTTERTSSDGESESESGFAWDVGGGIKWFVANRVALRVEYRIIHFPLTTEDIYLMELHYKITESRISHRIFVGISIFF